MAGAEEARDCALNIGTDLIKHASREEAKPLLLPLRSPLSLSHHGSACPPLPASPPTHRAVSALVPLSLDDLGSLLTHLASSLALFSDALCFSSQQIPGLDKLKLLYWPGGKPVTALAEVALLNTFRAAVVLTGLHHPVTATVRAPAVLSSHRPSLVWYTQ